VDSKETLNELILFATIANLQVNLEILEVSKQILEEHRKEAEELKKLNER